MTARLFFFRVAAVGFLTVVLGAGANRPVTGSPAIPREERDSPAPPLRLRLVSDMDPVRLDRTRVVRTFLENTGGKPVTLVKPGDGSRDAWRTPVVGCSLLRADDRTSPHQTLPSKPGFRGCGNLDPVRKDAVFTLAPGESREIGVGVPIPGPGRYRMVVYYRNIPKMKWHGVILGEVPGVMKRIQNSTACDLFSNELMITAIEPTARESGDAKILPIARKAVAARETWADRATYTARRESNGWSVMVSRIAGYDQNGKPLFTPRGDRLIKIDQNGRIIAYIRGE